MDDKASSPPGIQEIMDVFSRLGLEVTFGDLSQDDVSARGGMARVRDQKVVIIHSGLTDEEKVEVLMKELKKLDLSDLYLSPRLRQALGIENSDGDEI